MAALDPSVFRSYDIRGTYPDQLDEEFAYRFGRALAVEFATPRVAVGHDARLSSPVLYGALCAGLEHAGARVDAMGMCATELVYYAAGSMPELDLAVMITASHNPPEYNGFKVVKSGAEPVPAAAGLDGVRRAMEAMDVPLAPEAPAPPRTLCLEEDYLGFALELVGRVEAGGLRVVVDAGNGVAGILWELLAERLGLEPVRMNFRPDGRFPAHAPDPSRRQNLEPLVRRVRRERADIGFCYDGDADRLVVVLADGHVVNGSEMTACLADRLLAGGSMACGVAQTISRKALDYLRSHGLEPVMLPVGHAKIKKLLRAEPRMAFAGEDAGHYYYRDFFCCDSALVTTLHMLRAAAEGRLAPMIRSLPGPWHRPAREPAFSFARRADALRACRRAAASALVEFPDPVGITIERDGRILRRCAPADVEAADGVRVDYEDWWFCVRPSGTEPLARLAIEARAEELLANRSRWLCSLFET